MSQLFYQGQHALDIDLHDDEVPVFPSNNNQPLQGNEQFDKGLYLDEVYECIEEMRSGMRQETTKPCYLLNIWGLHMNSRGYGMTTWTHRPPPSEHNNIPVVLITAEKNEEGNRRTQDAAWIGAAHQIMEFLNDQFDICVQPFIAEQSFTYAPECENISFPGSDVICERIHGILSPYGFEDVNVQVFAPKPRGLYGLEFEDLNTNIHDYEFTTGGWW